MISQKRFFIFGCLKELLNLELLLSKNGMCQKRGFSTVDEADYRAGSVYLMLVA